MSLYGVLLRDGKSCHNMSVRCVLMMRGNAHRNSILRVSEPVPRISFLTQSYLQRPCDIECSSHGLHGAFGMYFFLLPKGSPT